MEDSHKKEIRDMQMIHRAEMAGADDAHELNLKELENAHSKEIETLLSKIEVLEKHQGTTERQDDDSSIDHSGD